jgi:DNA-binding protein H-NS
MSNVIHDAIEGIRVAMRQQSRAIDCINSLGEWLMATNAEILAKLNELEAKSDADQAQDQATVEGLVAEVNDLKAQLAAAEIDPAILARIDAIAAKILPAAPPTDGTVLPGETPVPTEPGA